MLSSKPDSMGRTAEQGTFCIQQDTRHLEQPVFSYGGPLLSNFHLIYTILFDIPWNKFLVLAMQEVLR